MPKLSSPTYVEKVKKLSKEESERLLSRMSGKLPRRLEKDKLSREEALALQMELEDEQLQEWRKMMSTLKQKDEQKEKSKGNATDKSKSDAKPKVEDKVKPSGKTQTVVAKKSDKKASAKSKKE